MDAQAKLAAIYRYPIKGLSPESLGSTRLTAGETIEADRLYAIENGPSGFDPAAPSYLPKQRFLMLMRNERLAQLKTRFDVATHGLAIELEGSIVASGDLRTPAGRSSIEGFLAQFCADELRGSPRVLHANGHSFSDVARKVVSIINLASVAEVESAVGAPVDPLRFRGNAREGRQAHSALRRDRGRSGHSRTRPADPAHAATELRPRRLRGLCGGDERR